MPLAPTNTPMWSSFCGHTNGVWQGRMAAFYAATGTTPLVLQRTSCFEPNANLRELPATRQK